MWGGAGAREGREGPGLGWNGLAWLRACREAGAPRPPHPVPRRYGAPCSGRGSVGCVRTACGSAALLPRRAFSAPFHRAALRGTALRARERRVRLAAAPCAGSAHAERGRLHDPPEDAAAAPSLCIPRLVRCGVSAADCHLVTCGRRRDLSKNPRLLPAQRSLGRVPVAP